MFKKKNELSILHDYSSVFEENANTKFLFDMIYG